MPGTKAGGPVRSIYSLCELLKQEFDFYILSSDTDLGCDKPYTNIRVNHTFEKEGIHYHYFSRDQLKPEFIIDEIKRIDPHLIYLNSFWSFPFSISIVKHKASHSIPAVLLAPRGMLSSGAMGLKRLKKMAFLIVAKLAGWYKDVPFHATNAQEKKDIQQFFSKNIIHIAANVNSGKALMHVREKKVNQLRLFYLSRIARVKNLHFALEALKQVPSDIQITYDIFGNPEDLEYKQACDRIVAELPTNVKVNYKGELPFHQVQQTICNYHALFLPTLNENFGHSIVESLLCGCLALISDQTPWNDLSEFEAGHAFPLDKMNLFIRSIGEMAGMDQDHFNRSSAKAIDYISAKIDLNQSLRLYKDMFNAAIENRSVKL